MERKEPGGPGRAGWLSALAEWDLQCRAQGEAGGDGDEDDGESGREWGGEIYPGLG